MIGCNGGTLRTLWNSLFSPATTSSHSTDDSVMIHSSSSFSAIASLLLLLRRLRWSRNSFELNGIRMGLWSKWNLSDNTKENWLRFGSFALSRKGILKKRREKFGGFVWKNVWGMVWSYSKIKNFWNYRKTPNFSKSKSFKAQKYLKLLILFKKIKNQNSSQTSHSTQAFYLQTSSLTSSKWFSLSTTLQFLVHELATSC